MIDSPDQSLDSGPDRSQNTSPRRIVKIRTYEVVKIRLQDVVGRSELYGLNTYKENTEKLGEYLVHS